MSHRLLISGALANVGAAVTTEEFLIFLSNQLPEAELYKLAGVKSAATDWRAILHDAAAVSAIAGALWLGYTELIAPKKLDPKSDSGIYIVIGNPQDENSQFWIGNDYKDKSIFLHNFKQRFKTIMETESAQGEIEREIIETEESSYWLKIK